MVKPAIVLIAALAAVSAFAQYSSNVWQTAADITEGVHGSMAGTVTDVDEAQNRFLMAPDNERNGQVQVVTDSVSTQYNGFGDVINGKPEIYTGSKGFSNIRAGDRVEVRGVGRSTGQIRGDFITLVGRSVPAPQVGVGDTRSPAQGTMSTPPVGSTTTVPGGAVEGTVQQVNANDNRIMIETNGRQIFTVRTARNTPVYYQGQTYEIGNLEVGDRIRVTADPTSSTGELRARSIQVVQSKEEASGARVSTVSGRVTRIDRTADVARVDTGRGEVRVDMSRAYDPNGRRVRASDLQVGDQVDISGAYGTTSDIFAATTIRFNDEGGAGTPGSVNAAGTGPAPEPGLVTISGTVTDTIANAGNLVLTERTTGRIVQLYASDDFVVRTKAGGYTTADKLTVDQNVIVKAYRDSDGNYIAQSIRLR